MKRTSIKHKFFISQILMIFTAVGLFFVLSVTYFTIKIKKDVETNLKYSSEITASNIENYLESIENCLKYTSINLDLPEMLSNKGYISIFERMENYNYVCKNFASIRSNYNFPIRITLYPQNNEFAMFDQEQVDLIYEIETNIENCMDGGMLFRHIISNGDERFFGMINELRNVNDYSEIVGYVGASVKMEQLELLLKNSTMENCRSLFFVSNNMVGTSDGDDISHEWAEIIYSVSAQEMKTIKLDKDKFYAVKKDIENTHCSVVVIWEKESAYETIYTMIFALSVLLICIFGVSLFVSNLVSKSLIDTLNVIINAMKKSQFGELQNVNHYDSSNAEMVEVINAYNYMITNIRDLINYNNLYQEQLRKYELAFLQMQIKPHFLYNTLDVIQYLAKENQIDNVTTLIMNLSKFYKISLHNKEDFVSISNELLHITYYVTIENFKYDNAIELRINISEDVKQMYIPKITFQPLVENAIKHGILEKDVPKGYIAITSRKENGDVYIDILDNGIGISHEKVKAIRSGAIDSIGILNTDRRLKNFFGSDYGLTIDGGEGYTKVTIKMRGIGTNDLYINCR